MENGYMSKDKTIDEKYKIAAEAISRAGGTPFPPTQTLLKLLTFFLNEDDLDYIAAFMDQKSQTMEQLKESSGRSEAELEKKMAELSKKGVIFNQPNSKGQYYPGRRITYIHFRSLRQIGGLRQVEIINLLLLKITES